MKSSVEILAPAGCMESLTAAINAGADAVYAGGSRFGARAYADNFTEEELLSAIDYVHIHGRKIYLTVNTLLKEDEMAQLYDYLLPYYERGLDAVIVQDIGAMDLIRSQFPGLPIHVSTQATVTGVYGAGFFKERGAQRIVPARELSLSEVRKMKEKSGLEIECFVHGALCYCYSGQCLMSSMIGGRSGNRGQCAQPCRLPYSAGNEKKKDLMSLKDLCTIDMIPELIDAGIDSFKIEGRMKQPEYVYTVVSMYRKYTDLYMERGKKGFKVSEDDIKMLQNIYRRRGYTKGYYKQHNGKNMISFQRPEQTDEERLSIPEEKMKEKINGKLIISKGESVKLYVSSGDISVICEGAEVQEALKQPLEMSRVDRQMRKTGNTEFSFEHLDIQMEDGVFLPMQAVNEVRREGIEKLEEAILASYRRDTPQKILPEKCGKRLSEEKISERKDTAGEISMELSVLVSKEEHFRQVTGDNRIDTIYADSGIAFEMIKDEKWTECRKKAGQKLFLAMPYIFRDADVRRFEAVYGKITELFDGVLIRNLESYQWLKEHGYSKEIQSDYNVYVFNSQSKKVLRNMSVSRFNAPVELNDKELSRLGISEGNLIVYGYQPVMVTANCIRKTTGACRHEDGMLYLTDRYQKKFAVKNDCQCCYNVVYNCQPLMLLTQQEEVKRLNPMGVRLDILEESPEQVEQMVKLHWECFKENHTVKVPDMDYTKGHFKRGVK